MGWELQKTSIFYKKFNLSTSFDFSLMMEKGYSSKEVVK